jgi:hypothetical protein
MVNEEWVVDSCASHHITGNPALMHDYVQFKHPVSLGITVKNSCGSDNMGQGIVCMKGHDGSAFLA